MIGNCVYCIEEDIIVVPAGEGHEQHGLHPWMLVCQPCLDGVIRWEQQQQQQQQQEEEEEEEEDLTGFCVVCLEDDQEVQSAGDVGAHSGIQFWMRVCHPCLEDLIRHQDQPENHEEDDEGFFDDFNDFDEEDFEPAPLFHQPEEDWDWWLLCSENLPFPEE